MRRLSFMLIAGEASGDLLAAELVKALNQSPEIRMMPSPPEFFGAGGPEMAEAGVDLAVNLTQYSVIGLSDSLKVLAVQAHLRPTLSTRARARAGHHHLR